MPQSHGDQETIPAGGVREVKSAARTVEILEFLAARKNKPVRLRELSEALGVPRSSLHALLRTLAKHGWVRADSTGTLYGIGIRALLAGTTYLDTDPYLPVVTPLLDELREQLDETFHFGRLDGTTWSTSRPASRASTSAPTAGSVAGCRRTPPRWARRSWPTCPSPSSPKHLPKTLDPLTPQTITTKKKLVAELERDPPSWLRDRQGGEHPRPALLRGRAATTPTPPPTRSARRSRWPG